MAPIGSLTLGLALVAAGLWFVPASAQGPKSPPVSAERVQGIWYYGDDCPSARARFTIRRDEARYVDLTDATANFSTRILETKVEGGAVVLVYEEGSSTLRPEGASRLKETFRRNAEPPQELELFRCPGRDRIDAFLVENDFAAVTDLLGLVADPCREGREADCVWPIWGFADINNDSLLTTAEIARALRRVGKWAARLGDPDLPTADAMAVHALGLLVAPLIARAVIDNYDFDGDGKLSTGELLAGTSVPELAALFADDPTALIGGRGKAKEWLEMLLPLLGGGLNGSATSD